LTRNVSESNVT